MGNRHLLEKSNCLKLDLFDDLMGGFNPLEKFSINLSGFSIENCNQFEYLCLDKANPYQAGQTLSLYVCMKEYYT